MERQFSYSELVELQVEFDRQVEEQNIDFVELDIDESDDFIDFCDQWVHGNDNPKIYIPN